MRQLFFTLLLVYSVNAQNWQEMKGIFNPTGLEMKHFTAPFFFDVDGDGDKDLNLCYLSSRSKFYINQPVNGLPRFTEDTNYLAQIAIIDPQNYYSYAVFGDLNGDGKMDMITGSFNGFSCYYNLGTHAQPQWVKDDSVFIPVNPLIGSDAKPALGDLDGDGDLDLLAGIGESLLGGPTAGITRGFRNIGTPTAPRFEEYTQFVNNIPDVGLNSYPTLEDINNDGKLDLLIGRDLASFYFFRNDGTVNAPQWTYINQYINTETSHYWKNPHFVDLDNDNDFDLVYGTDDGNLNAYQNNGTASTPLFQYNGTWFPVVKVSGHSTTSFADIDNDGDLDLISGTSTGQVRLIQNNGTAIQPQFALTAGNYGNISTSSYSFPRFADFDKDGDQDVVTGATDGKVYLYLRDGNTFTLANWFSAFDAGWTSIPAPVDIDNDGDIDLLIGCETAAEVIFLENTGNNIFVKNQSFISGINFGSYNKPAFGDVDNDGDQDLIIGNLFGSLKFYENTGTATLPSWQEKSSLVAGIERDQNSTPFFADIDGDTKKDLIIGDSDGNFIVYKNLFAPVSIEDDQNFPSTFQVSESYPNPFNGSTRFGVSAVKQGEMVITVSNASGESVIKEFVTIDSPGVMNYDFNPGRFALPSGVYFIVFDLDGKKEVRKTVYLK